MTGMTYATYLHLDELLSLQHPLTPVKLQDEYDNERLFIVVHQSSETLLSQALVDLRHIWADQCGQRCFAHRAERVTRLIDALEGQLTLLRHTLKPEDFMRFRDRIGTASGLQSEQFHELFALTECLMPGGTGHLLPLEPRQRDGLGAAVRRWRRTHLELVEHMIGDLPGTAETSGIRYLASRLNGTSQAEHGGCVVAAGKRAHS